MSEEVLRRCKKCLLRDIDKNEYFESLKQAIEAIDPAEKTPAPLYEERLSACTACDRLSEGMCTVCGCFVEYRAAKSKEYCPDVHRKW